MPVYSILITIRIQEYEKKRRVAGYFRSVERECDRFLSRFISTYEVWSKLHDLDI
jgi:hypothetical protein